LRHTFDPVMLLMGRSFQNRKGPISSLKRLKSCHSKRKLCGSVNYFITSSNFAVP